MREQSLQNLPWLDRLAIAIPGYGGYHKRAHRRAADQALRDAVAHRLAAARTQLDQAIRQCVDRQALTEITALERVGRHLDRVADRVRSAGSGIDAFYEASDLASQAADPLHAIDVNLLELADDLVRRFDESDAHHDRLALIEADLRSLEHRLDERGQTLRAMSAEP